jgi:hypothetical protein
MSVNLTTGIIPFTELFERLMTLAKIDSFNNEDYAKGLVNDAYTRSLPGLNDWNPLITEAFLSTTAYYATGTIACTAGSTSVTGTGTVWTSGMTNNNGWKIKFAGLDNVYSFTYASGTTATISPALEGATYLTASNYTLFRDEFALASDFDRFLKNGSIYVQQGGRTHDTIAELPRDQFRSEFTPEPSDPIFRAMLTRVNTSGYRMVRLNPPPRTAKVYPYEYIPKLTPLKEYVVGTVSVTNASTTVTGSSTLFAANVVAGMYFRVDSVGQGDSSKWYKIASVTSNTVLVLESAYEDAAESGTEYTICSAPTGLPSEFHEFILYEAVSVAVGSNADANTEVMLSRRNEILTRLNKNYKSRRTNTQIKVEDDGYR